MLLGLYRMRLLAVRSGFCGPSSARHSQGDVPGSARTRAAALFDHLVGYGENAGRNGEAERFGDLEVD
jgi:hypothetical protein